ncbi:MAG: hypothetical protein HC945_02345 [Nitrosarchaeum sp.]|nr:hypothetical protein [Nitrosarchaeum sp.]
MKDTNCCKDSACCNLWIAYTWLGFGLVYIIQTWFHPHLSWFSKIFPWDAMLFVLIGLTLLGRKQ